MNRVNKELLPRAQVGMLNRACKAAHGRSIRNIKSDFTLRNPYTLNSIKFSPAKVRSSGVAGYAVTGSKSPYLPIQETGGTIRAKKSKIPVPTLAGRRGKWRKPIPPALRMNRMGEIGTEGSKFFFLTSPGGKKGIFTRKGKKKIVKVRDISRRSYRVRGTHWHSEAVKKFGNKRVMGQVFVQEAKKQLAKIAKK